LYVELVGGNANEDFPRFRLHILDETESGAIGKAGQYSAEY